MATTSEQIISALKRTPTNIAGGPVDLANLIMGAVAGKGTAGLVDKPTGGSEQLAALFGNQKKGGNAEAVTELLTSLIPSPATATTAAKAIVVPAALIKNNKTVVSALVDLKNGKKIPEQVFKETGIFADPKTGELTATINDSNARFKEGALKVSSMYSPGQNTMGPRTPSVSLNVGYGETAPLQDILDHPELYAALPELRNMSVGADWTVSGKTSGYYDPKTDSLAIQKVGTPEDLMSLLLHETQHAVQTKTGMPGGGNTAMFAPKTQQNMAAATKARGLYEDTGASRGAQSTVLDKTLGPILEAINNANTAAFSNYKKLAGEAQSRAVEAQYKARDYSKPTTAFYDADAPINELILPADRANYQVDPPASLFAKLQKILDAYGK